MRLTIDLKYSAYDPALYARRTWQHLFNTYQEHGGPTNDLDSLLRDLKSIERYFDHEHQRESMQNGLFWTHHHGTSNTSTYAYDPAAITQQPSTRSQHVKPDTIIHITYKPGSHIYLEDSSPNFQTGNTP